MTMKTVLLLIALSYLCQVSFANEPKYVDILTGGNATLTCQISFSNGQCERIVWVRYQEQTPDDIQFISTCTNVYDDKLEGLPEDDIERFKPVKDTSSISLNIKHVIHRDTDYIYKCRKTGQKPDGASMRIRIHTPVCETSVIDKWSKIDQYEVRLNCTIDIIPRTQLTWYNSDKSRITQPMESSSGQSLSVPLNLNEMDNYKNITCVATPAGLPQDPNGPAFCTVTPLQIPPVVDIIPSTLTVTPGDNATFTCKPRVAYPSNAYVFHLNGTPLSPTSVKHISRWNSSTAELTIINVSIEDTNSIITCVVYNAEDFGEKVESKRANLYVSRYIVSFEVSSFNQCLVTQWLPPRQLTE